MRIINPIVDFPEPEQVSCNPLPENLSGAHISILNNQKPNATEMLRALVEHLGSDSEYRWHTKSPPKPASSEVLKQITDNSIMAIVGSGD